MAKLHPDWQDTDLVRFDRKLLKEGELTKARKSTRVKRHVFLCNDIMLSCASTAAC